MLKIPGFNKKFSIFNFQSLMGSKGLAPLEITRPWTSVKSLSGFTLIEMTVVVAIMAVLIIASMPLFRDFARSRDIEDASSMLVAALTKTRGAAITYRERYWTVLDTNNDAVAIYRENDLNNPAENWKKLPGFVKFDTTGSWNVSGPIPTDLSKYYVEFKPNGALGSGATVNKITIIEEDTGSTRIVEISGLTGRIKVEE